MEPKTFGQFTAYLDRADHSQYIYMWHVVAQQNNGPNVPFCKSARKIVNDSCTSYYLQMTTVVNEQRILVMK